ncbi:MAG: hypothetical protein AVDCRST_MAG59-3179, partial [uncultured Thermomicrobiales bacterium]
GNPPSRQDRPPEHRDRLRRLRHRRLDPGRGRPRDRGGPRPRRQPLRRRPLLRRGRAAPRRLPEAPPPARPLRRRQDPAARQGRRPRGAAADARPPRPRPPRPLPAPRRLHPVGSRGLLRPRRLDGGDPGSPRRGARRQHRDHRPRLGLPGHPRRRPGALSLRDRDDLLQPDDGRQAGLPPGLGGACRALPCRRRRRPPPQGDRQGPVGRPDPDPPHLVRAAHRAGRRRPGGRLGAKPAGDDALQRRRPLAPARHPRRRRALPRVRRRRGRRPPGRPRLRGLLPGGL